MQCLCATIMTIGEAKHNFNEISVIIVFVIKVYRFSDPDPHVIIAQLSQLYKTLKYHERYQQNEAGRAA